MGNRHTKQRSARYKVKDTTDKDWVDGKTTASRNGNIRRRSDTGGASAKASAPNTTENFGESRNRSSTIGDVANASKNDEGGFVTGTGRGGSVIGDSGYGSIGRNGFAGSSGFAGGGRKSSTVRMAGGKSVSFSNGPMRGGIENGCNTIGRCIYGYAGNVTGTESNKVDNNIGAVTAGSNKTSVANVIGSSGRINHIGNNAKSTTVVSSNSTKNLNGDGNMEPIVKNSNVITNSSANLTASNHDIVGSSSISSSHHPAKSNGGSSSVVGSADNAAPLRLGVSRNANVTGPIRQSMLDVSVRAGEGEQSAFVTAAGLGCADMVKMLLEIGVPPDLPDQNGLTALHAAAESGHVAVIELLIGGGVSLCLILYPTKSNYVEHRFISLYVGRQKEYNNIVAILILYMKTYN